MSTPAAQPKVALCLKQSLYESMFSAEDRVRLRHLAEVINPEPPADADEAFLQGSLAEAEIAITSWHTPSFGPAVLARAPRLKMVCHAGGSVRPIVTPDFWRRGLRITSAAAAIAFGVAEFCLGLILLGSKRAFWLGLATREGRWKDAGRLFGGWHEIYRQKIGIVGAGLVGRQLISLLRGFRCEILAYDPFVSAPVLRELGATKVESLDLLFESCSVVSLNAALTPDTPRLIRASHLARLRPGSLFINTARGGLVHEDELVEQLATGRFVACLDVTDQEPPPADHPLRRLPNVWLTPHVAGAVAENQMRVGSLAVDEIARHASGQAPLFEVTADMLSSMA